MKDSIVIFGLWKAGGRKQLCLTLVTLLLSTFLQAQNNEPFCYTLIDLAKTDNCIHGRAFVNRQFEKVAVSIGALELNPEDTVLANATWWLADCLYSQGKNDSARIFYEYTSEILERTAGARSKLYLLSLVNISAILDLLERYPDAEKIYLKILEIDKSSEIEFTKAHGITLFHLAQNLDNQNKSTKAIEIYETIVTRFKSLMRDSATYEYAVTLGNLGYHYLELGRFKESVSVCEEAYSLLKGVELNEYLLSLINTIATGLDEQGQYLKAEKYYEILISHGQELLGADRYWIILRSLDVADELVADDALREQRM